MPFALSDYGVAELEPLLASRGIGRVHGARIVRGLLNGEEYHGCARGSAHKVLRAFLEEIPRSQSHILTRRQSADGTVKLLIGFDRGGRCETVLMPSFRPDRAMGCVSS